MYLSMLAQMEDKYPPQAVREAEHRRALAASRSRHNGRRRRLADFLPIRARASAPCADSTA
jgi:hypothetical protein